MYRVCHTREGEASAEPLRVIARSEATKQSPSLLVSLRGAKRQSSVLRIP